ncbi:MAG TPA: ATP-binding protein [Burkholderiaceae bacterium]|nr:ATP-binding protein [Burkholderiaceae bacterium]
MTQLPPSGLPHTVLIATSSAPDLSELQRLLSRHGLQLQSVSKGDSVLNAATQGGIALVLLDVTLAGSASFELCQRLSQGTRVHAPVFLLSATPSEDERARATAAGASRYLALPFQADALAEQIVAQLGKPATTPPAPRLDDLEINYHTLLAGSPDAVLLLDLEQNRLVNVNRSTCQMLGRTESALLQSSLLALCPPVQPDGRSSSDRLAEHMAMVAAGDIRVFEARFSHGSGRPIDCELRMVALEVPGRRLMHIRLVDVTARKRAEALREGQNKLLEMVAGGAPLQATLDQLMLLIESQADGVLCSVMLLQADGRTMTPASGPSLPADYLRKLDGVAIGPGVGSCGTAMFRKETVIVSDIEVDPLWAPYKQLAAPFGLRACWSIPILLDGDKVLGSFAMYYREVRSPAAADQRLISVATHLAGIAIVRARREEELARHQERLEEQVAARTAELQKAKEQAEMANDELSTALDNLSMTQDELVRRDKLAALGTLVAGVAHELNTPIGNSLVVATTMSERLRALRQDVEGGLRRSALESFLTQATEADEVVVRNLTRAAGLVDSFKRIAVDAASSQRRRFLLDRLVTELVLPLQAAVKGCDLTVIEDIAPNLELDSYPGPLDQALTHLFDNSVLHGFDSRTAGTITIRARPTAAGEVELTLADNGVGIAPAALARVYDPFYTTRLGHGSSGLGLYITHNIVTGVLGGRIEAASTPDQGTCFTLLLPAVAPR